jgi:glycerol kinase
MTVGMNGGYILAIDQGTTSSRALLFDGDCNVVHVAQKELPQIYPQSGWVEHDPELIWQDTLEACRQCIAVANGLPVHAIGITNQRETTLLWDRRSGVVLHNAIVWQDRRTAARCQELEAQGYGEMITARTGLLLDPYFSATKLAWLLDNVTGAREAAEKGDLAFGTVDSFLLWRLTGGLVHATDATNAARTQLFDIHRQVWDDDLLALHNIPPGLLPQVRDCAGLFAETDPDLLGRALPVMGMAGDQQAATFGQAAFQPGTLKSTYGTGCFALLNTGDKAFASKNRLLTTVAWRLDGKVTYALEGSIFVAGAAVQWLRDQMKFFADSAESEAIAASAASTDGVYMVPAFTGLGAPYWDADARGALIGLNRDTGIAQITRAVLEAVCYQTKDLADAMTADGAPLPPALRVDGGMSNNNWCMQFLSDILDIPVERPMVTETTALGAASLAGLACGFYPSMDQIAARWQCDQRFEPKMKAAVRDSLYAGWQTAVGRTRTT